MGTTRSLSPYASPLERGEVFFLNTNQNHFPQSNNMLVNVVLHGTIDQNDF